MSVLRPSPFGSRRPDTPYCTAAPDSLDGQRPVGGQIPRGVLIPANGACSMAPISLSDEELTAIMSACQPLDVQSRGPFLEVVARALQGCDVIGPGTVHRIIVETQRHFFHPPNLSRANASTRWSR